MDVSAIGAAVDNFATEVLPQGMNIITGNAALMVLFVAGSVIPIAFYVFKRAKKSVR